MASLLYCWTAGEERKPIPVLSCLLEIAFFPLQTDISTSISRLLQLSIYYFQMFTLICFILLLLTKLFKQDIFWAMTKKWNYLAGKVNYSYDSSFNEISKFKKKTFKLHHTAVLYSDRGSTEFIQILQGSINIYYILILNLNLSKLLYWRSLSYQVYLFLIPITSY